MNENVVHLDHFRASRDTRFVSTSAAGDEWVRNNITMQLRQICEPERIEIAVARAVRRIHMGNTVADSIKFAVAWARDADPDRDPPAAA